MHESMCLELANHFSFYFYLVCHRGIPQWGSKGDSREDCKSHNPSRSWFKNYASKLKRKGIKDSMWWEAAASIKVSVTPWRARLVWEYPVFILIEKACNQGWEGHLCISSHEVEKEKKWPKYSERCPENPDS